MSTIPVSSRPNGSADALRPSLPAFESANHRSRSRDGRPESSASGSGRSRSNAESREKFTDRRGLSSTKNTGDGIGVNGTQSHSRTTSHRSSGGFLLGSIGRTSRIPRMATPSSDDPKGKRKSEDAQLAIPKRRTRQVQTQSGSSLASSPLATEVHRDSVSELQNGAGRLIPGTDVRQSVDALRTHTTSSDNNSGQHLELKRPAPAVVGYDTDPSQIVNMALSLSEARRRQASIKRYASNDQHGRRIVSTPSGNPNRTRIPSGSIAHYLPPGRPVSASLSTNGHPHTPKALQEDHAGRFTSSTEDANVEGPSLFNEAEISEATAARVQRAKNYFELAYEHRRLLSHLPPIRRPGAYVKSSDPSAQSKAYNPLQYVRNRKLRIWDKTTFNAEAEGWHDVERVRKWVDAVSDGQHEPRDDPAECVRLPPLSRTESLAGENDQESSSKDRPHVPSNDHPKPRRPRSDWTTHPGDMLADCFWLEQGVNKIKIRDRDNNQIYPPDTHFRFSGWRNRTPVDVPANLQQPTAPPERTEESDQEPLNSPAPALPTFKSAHHTADRGHQGRKRSKIKDSFAAMEDGGNKRKGLKLFMDDTSDDSGSDRSPGSAGGERDRGRKRLTRKRQREHSSSRSPGAEPLTTTNTKDSIFASTLSPSEPSSTANSKRASIDHSRFGRYLKRDTTKGHTPLSRSQNRAEHNRQDSSTKFPSFHDRPRSSAEYDTTVPNSPVNAAWPSIAINLESPPASRSPSPSKKKPSILHAFRDRSHDRHEKVSTTDFAELSPTGSHQPSGDAEKQQLDSSRSGSRGTSPMTRGQSPLSKRISQPAPHDLAITAGDNRSNPVSRVNSKSAAPSNDHSKIRGMFKGGRIAELVGHEVSRVGDFIWKRDIPQGYRRRGSTSTASTLSNPESDIEEGGYTNGDVFKTPQRPRVRSRRASTLSSTKSEQFTSPVSSKSPPSGERPKYNNPNLPSFVSPFERDKEVQEERKQALLTPTTSPPDSRDHISKMAAEHRTASRSPRMERLALPKLDTGGGTSPVDLQRKTSYGFGASVNLSRSRDASDKFNSAISDDGRGIPGTKSATDLSRISTSQLSQKADEPQQVTRSEIERAIALLMCSAVKAREIGRRANIPRPQVAKYLLDATAADGSEHHHVDLSLVRRREEHVVAARVIMSRLSTQASAFDEKMKRFSSTIAPALHMELQTLEDLVDKKLTPRVRLSADEAGELSQKLSTTSTLAVKGLNDAINGAFRRRRRGPIRWVWRTWYASIEYFVVSLLWGIWAVVTIVRIVLAIVGGSTSILRWLLWMD